jgi:hypothetical protein
MHEEKAYIFKVGTMANSSRQLLHMIGIEGRVVASFGGNFIRFGYEFLYSRRNYVGHIADSIPAVQMVAESKTEDDEQRL